MKVSAKLWKPLPGHPLALLNDPNFNELSARASSGDLGKKLRNPQFRRSLGTQFQGFSSDEILRTLQEIAERN